MTVTKSDVTHLVDALRAGGNIEVVREASSSSLDTRVHFGWVCVNGVLAGSSSAKDDHPIALEHT